MRTVLAVGALLSLLCGASLGADTREADVLRLLEALEKAGLKVQAGETDQAAIEAEPAEDDAAFREVLNKLQAPEMSVEYQDAPLASILAELQKATGVNLVLDPRLTIKGKDPDVDRGENIWGDPTPVDHLSLKLTKVSLKLEKVKPISVLENLLRMYDLVAIYGSEAIMVTVPAAEEPITLVYDVHELTAIRDFAFQDKRITRELSWRARGYYPYRYVYFGNEDELAEEKARQQEPSARAEILIKLLKTATPNGRWDDARCGITWADGVLVVTQRPSAQIEIGNILIALKTRR
ncbi:MAG TPA: hypothetical protein VM223_19955 [Planctomycetota bacterium]|nr:hypothetical protein [Planctomycetota bacterium]